MMHQQPGSSLNSKKIKIEASLSDVKINFIFLYPSVCVSGKKFLTVQEFQKVRKHVLSFTHVLLQTSLTNNKYCLQERSRSIYVARLTPGDNMHFIGCLPSSDTYLGLILTEQTGSPLSVRYSKLRRSLLWLNRPRHRRRMLVSLCSEYK